VDFLRQDPLNSIRMAGIGANRMDKLYRAGTTRLPIWYERAPQTVYPPRCPASHTLSARVYPSPTPHAKYSHPMRAL